MNPEVNIYRYVTNATFDAYLWQTVENKQKFISQIMTSKSPVRSCEDVDETALSYAEIKALCAGDPRIREKMDLDVEVARLRLMKADHQSKKYRLEDQLISYYPAQIKENEGFIAGFNRDLETLAAHPLPEDKNTFVGMEIKGNLLTKEALAGAAILEACKEEKENGSVIGHYRGLEMGLNYDPFAQKFILTLRGEMSHPVELGTDARGNLVRIANALNAIPGRIKATQARLDALIQQQETARTEIAKPFPQEAELAEKSARLAFLDAELNIDKGREAPSQDVLQKSAKPSLLAAINSHKPVSCATKKHRDHEMEVR